MQLMLNQKLPASDYHLFTLKSLLWLVFGWTGFLLTLAGFFYGWVVWLAFFLAMGILLKNELRNRTFFRTSKELLVVSAIIVIFIATLSCFSTPTVFSGRDQGSISEAAVRLAQNHKLTFSTPASDVFFKIRGAGRALNFPGFFYTKTGELITQFPLAYIAWLASFYAAFGLIGFTLANAVLSIFFLITFYLIARSFMPLRASLASLLLVATSISIYWFPKYTLSENLALTLLWVSLFALLAFLKKQNKLNLLLYLSASTLLAFTRIEGIAFLITSTGIIFFSQPARAYLKKLFDFKFLLGLVFLLLVFIANLFWDLNFYKELVKAILPITTTPQATELAGLGNPINPEFYILKIFSLYGMLSFFLLATAACIFYAVRRNTVKLLPLLVIAPSLIYFLDSHISPDHPWMLRRFAFSLLPVAIFYCALILSDLNDYLSSQQKNVFLKAAPVIIALALLSGNLPAFLQFATFSENKNLLEQTTKISQLFSSKDLILIDSQVTGDGWAMLAGPMNFLNGKNAAYFFNTQDLAKLDFKNFENVYLITPDSRIPFYTNSTISQRLVPIDQYALTTSRLELESASITSDIPIHFPEKKALSIHGIIFKVLK
jgi:hypothetical protein